MKSTNTPETSDSPQSESETALSRSQIAKLANVSEMTVQRWIDSGELAAWDASAGSKNSRWRVWPRDWEAFQERRRSGTQPGPIAETFDTPNKRYF